MNRTLLMARLLHHEGHPPEPYKDSLGIWTAGVGHKIDSDLVSSYVHFGTLGELLDYLCSPSTHEKWFDLDVTRAINDAQRYIGKEAWEALSDARQQVLAEMAFQMGGQGLMGFWKLRRAVLDAQWVKAEAEMLDSRWATQTPNRARELASRMLEGG